MCTDHWLTLVISCAVLLLTVYMHLRRQQQQQQHNVVHAPQKQSVKHEDVQQVEQEQEAPTKESKRQRLKKAAAGAWRGIRSLVSYSTIHTILFLYK
jgi:hypothetical protein